MKMILLLSATLVTVALILLGCFMTSSYNLTGTWFMTQTIGNRITTGPITITQTGNTLTYMTNYSNYTGTVSGTNVSFSDMIGGNDWTYTGSISDSTNISGTVIETTANGLRIIGTWSDVEESTSIVSYNLTGTWLMTVTVLNYTSNELITISQTGKDLTITTNNGVSFTRIVNVNNVQFSTIPAVFTGIIINSRTMGGTFTTTYDGAQVTGSWSAVLQN